MSGTEGKAHLSIDEMHGRIALGDMLAEALEVEGDSDEAIAILRGQQQELREEIARREGTPPPVVVNLQTGALSAVIQT